MHDPRHPKRSQATLAAQAERRLSDAIDRLEQQEQTARAAGATAVADAFRVVREQLAERIPATPDPLAADKLDWRP